MKKLFMLALLGCAMVSFAQNDGNINSIAEAEMKAASSLQHLAVNPNTQNYDITFHRLKFTVNPAVYFISGNVTTTYTALANMSTITFDLTDELIVSSVTRNSVPLTFIQTTTDELVINLGTTQTAGTSATLVITYSGQPSSDEGAFTTTSHFAQPVLYTLSEPFGARDWWPCKQDLNDKVDNIEVWITAPAQFTAVSNGLQQSAVVTGLNKTTIWHHNYPIPAYLIAIAVTNYSVFTQQAGTPPNEFPIINYYYPENTQAVSQLAQTLPIMNLYESLFETYPFADEKYGHAQFSWGGGMEHTTISFMANFSRDLIAHELAHQWFGDKITCGSWNDIWLNEGFATYLTGLTVENLDGAAEFVDWKGGLVNSITSSPGGSVFVPESESANVSRIFSSRLSYNKGAMVCEMLRWKLGDAVFFQGVRNYLADPDLAYDFAVTQDLQGHLEAASGQDLDEFFADWVYGQGYPSYDITADPNGNGQVAFTINQSQSHPSVSFFEMPVPVRVFGTNGEQLDIVLQNTADNQTLLVPVPFTMAGFEIDPHVHLVSSNNNTTLGTAAFNRESIVIYPNPTDVVLNISIPDYVTLQNAIIYNNLGQVVLESSSHELSVETLSTGVHFVKLITSEGTYHKKFIKK